MALVWALLVACVVLFGPGAALLRLLAGLDRFSAVALAPAVSVGFVAIIGLLPGGLGGFTPLTAGVAGLLLLAACWAGRVARPADGEAETPADDDRAPRHPRGTRWAVAGTVLGALAGGWVWWPAIWPVSAVAQNIDVNWHAYTTAVIRQLQSGNPFRLVPLDPLTPALRDFYPIGLHLVIDLTTTGQQSVAVGINATQFVLAVLVTPLGVVALSRHLLPTLPQAWPVAPVLVGLSANFAPKLVGLVPYVATLALLPGMVALLLTVQARGWRPRSAVVALLAPAALFAVQPAGAFTACAVAGLGMLEAALRSGRGRRLRELGRLAAWSIAAGALASFWALASAGKAGSTFRHTRHAYTRLVGAAGDLAQLSWLNRATPPLWWVWPAMLACAAGLVWLGLRGRALWPAASYAVFGGLYLVAAGYRGPLHTTLTGLWFGDWYRIIPVATLMMTLGGAAAVAAAVAVTDDRSPGSSPAPLGTRPGGGALPRRLGPLTAVALVLLLAGTWMLHQAQPARGFVQVSRRPSVVTAGDLAAFTWLAAHVGPRERVLNDWTEGTEWMYATDRVVPFEVYSGMPPDRAQLVADFERLGTDPTVVQRLRAYDIHYVIVAGTALPGTHATLRLPPDGRGLRLEFRNADASIYRIVAAD